MQKDIVVSMSTLSQILWYTNFLKRLKKRNRQTVSQLSPWNMHSSVNIYLAMPLDIKRWLDVPENWGQFLDEKCPGIKCIPGSKVSWDQKYPEIKVSSDQKCPRINSPRIKRVLGSVVSLEMSLYFMYNIMSPDRYKRLPNYHPIFLKRPWISLTFLHVETAYCHDC